MRTARRAVIRRKITAAPERRLIAMLICIAIGGVAGLVLLQLFSIMFSGGYALATALAMVVPLAILALVLPRIWRAINGDAPLAKWPEEFSPREAARELEGMAEAESPAPETVVKAGPTPPPAPPRNAPMLRPPAPSVADWVLAGTCGIFGLMFLAFPVVILSEALRTRAQIGSWTGIAMAFLISGSLGAGLLLGAKMILKTPRREWLEQAAAQARACGNCGYDVRGVRGVCPECGQAIPLVESAEEIAARLELFANEGKAPADRDKPPL
jgi:hypothetical protein